MRPRFVYFPLRFARFRVTQTLCKVSERVDVSYFKHLGILIVEIQPSLNSLPMTTLGIVEGVHKETLSLRCIKYSLEDYRMVNLILSTCNLSLSCMASFLNGIDAPRGTKSDIPTSELRYH